jgi:hypothetical protein
VPGSGRWQVAYAAKWGWNSWNRLSETNFRRQRVKKSLNMPKSDSEKNGSYRVFKLRDAVFCEKWPFWKRAVVPIPLPISSASMSKIVNSILINIYAKLVLLWQNDEWLAILFWTYWLLHNGYQVLLKSHKGWPSWFKLCT